MTLLQIIDTLLLGPLKLLFEGLFRLAEGLTGSPAFAIVALSIAINILVLPLYARADTLQKQVREKEKKLARGVAHIRKSFAGELRTMTLHTYYRQNGYSPIHSLKGSVTLLLEIPFFIAAYQFLSGLQSLSGVPLGPIADLSRPDEILKLGGHSLNLLPLLMTGINILSGALYLKGAPLREKLQVYLTALVFLVLLYGSPACLVLYWTLNNLFSLCKNLLGCLPKKEKPAPKKREAEKPMPWLYFLGALFMTVLVGLVIPSAYLADSPQEYVQQGIMQDPRQYLISSGTLAAGFFLVWLSVFYLLATPKGKRIFEKAVWILCGIMLMDYLFFGTKLGVISPMLKYNDGMHFGIGQQLCNLLAAAALGVGLYYVCVKWRKVTPYLLLTAVIAFGIITVKNTAAVGKSIRMLDAQPKEEQATLTLDRSGKNVVIIMLDRAAGHLLPYLVNEKPELKETYDGFTYYSNVIAFGGCTNLSSPSLFGGYEYTPVEMNRRKTERLVDKHNEAIKMLPTLFSQRGFAVTVCDPVYANYQTIPDLRVFEDIPGVKAYITEGRFTQVEDKAQIVTANHRNFFCFGFMKTMPLVLQPLLYDGGQYYGAAVAAEPEQVEYSSQKVQGTAIADGLSGDFMDAYNVLDHLPEITRITDTGQNTYLSLTNETTHDPMLLQAPDYIPAAHVDNTAYDRENTARFTVNGVTLTMETEAQFTHYHANMAALLQLGQWLEHLRQQGVYDNTRIILVSDHSHPLYQTELQLEGGMDKNLERYFPLLMVKDFNATGFKTADTFMTLADVPLLATARLLTNPVNPYTGKQLTDREKFSHAQHIITSFDWDPIINNGNQFMPSGWLAVRNNIWDESQWVELNKKQVLVENVVK